MTTALPFSIDVVSTLPQVTASPDEAAELLERDGAVVVTGHPTGSTDVAPLLQAMLGGRIHNVGDPVEVRNAGGQDVPDQNETGHLIPSPLHTDGFGLGDNAPDVVALACEIDSPGGDSMLVDMPRLFDALVDAGGEWAELADFLLHTEIDQTEPDKIPTYGTIAVTAADGSVWWRCPYYTDPHPQDPNPERTEVLLQRWRDLLHTTFDLLPRFHLNPGDTLIVDNMRLFHGRDPYENRARLLWRVWCWTDRALRPDTEYAVSDTSAVRIP